MINLLPDDMKLQFRAARVNVILLRYIFVIVLAFAFLALVLFGAYVVLSQTRANALQLIAVNDARADIYSDTRAQVESLSTSLAEARAILNDEISYSNVLVNFSQQMPAGTVIENMTLNTGSFTGTPLTLKVYAKSAPDITALRESFQNSPLFSNVNLQSVSDTTGGLSDYPVSATMTLTLNRAITR